MSTKPIAAGEITAAPGQVARGFLTTEVGRGVSVRMPVVVINGKADGPVFAVTAGVHGAEYPGIEAAIRLSRTLDPAEVRGAVIVVPVVSVPAYQRRAIYVNPLDGINFNRVCPGNPVGTITEIMADLLFKNVIAQADHYIDLHGGDMIEALVPFTLYYKSGNRDGGRCIQGAGRGVRHPDHPGDDGLRGGSSAAAAMGKPAILPEAGGRGILDEPSTQTHIRGCCRFGRPVVFQAPWSLHLVSLRPNSSGWQPSRTACTTRSRGGAGRSGEGTSSRASPTCSARRSASCGPPPRARCCFLRTSPPSTKRPADGDRRLARVGSRSIWLEGRRMTMGVECPKCGLLQLPGPTTCLPGAASQFARLRRTGARPPAGSPGLQTGTHTLHRLAFHGAGSFLLGIHIVNVLLTIVTLGVYYFWAKVRVEEYILSQTECAGDRFHPGRAGNCCLVSSRRCC